MTSRFLYVLSHDLIISFFHIQGNTAESVRYNTYTAVRQKHDLPVVRLCFFYYPHNTCVTPQNTARRISLREMSSAFGGGVSSPKAAHRRARLFYVQAFFCSNCPPKARSLRIPSARQGFSFPSATKKAPRLIRIGEKNK